MSGSILVILELKGYFNNFGVVSYFSRISSNLGVISLDYGV